MTRRCMKGIKETRATSGWSPSSETGSGRCDGMLWASGPNVRVWRLDTLENGEFGHWKGKRMLMRAQIASTLGSCWAWARKKRWQLWYAEYHSKMSNCCSDVALARDDDPSDNVRSRAKASPLGWKLVLPMGAEAAALGKLAIAIEGQLSNGDCQPYSSTCEWALPIQMFATHRAECSDDYRQSMAPDLWAGDKVWEAEEAVNKFALSSVLQEVWLRSRKDS
jgi:hypothetical protein